MNWKTTVTGLVSAGAAFVVFAQGSGYTHFPQIVTLLAAFVQMGGMAGLGLTAKDFNTTGGTKPATLEAQRRIEAAAPSGGNEAPVATK